MKNIRGKPFLYILASILLLFTLVGGTWMHAAAATQVNVVIPTISILSVSPDVSVTIRTANFPANDTYKVYMNFFGTRGVDGVLVDTIDSGSGGTFDKTFTIPSEMKGLKQVAIRLESPYSGYFSYNWFNNVSGGTIPDTGGPLPPTPGLTPTISISSVSPDNTVTIQTYNYPANDTFNVLMGAFGTRGVGGTKVDTFDTGSGGSFSKTFTIPSGLKGLAQIAIRLESPTSGYFSYNWFNNVSGGTIPDTGGPLPPTPGLIPTFSISSVDIDSTVTIVTSNFPANDTFNVLMGNFGTRGVGGVKVDTISTGSGGTLTLTFSIPDSLKGKGTIAIRLESPTSGYFSYNWFYN
jgi:hypothetical protein